VPCVKEVAIAFFRCKTQLNFPLKIQVICLVVRQIGLMLFLGIKVM
jgi:hypothetical protein